jgi:hypothetical protein
MNQFRRRRTGVLISNNSGGNGLKLSIATRVAIQPVPFGFAAVAPKQATKFVFSDAVETVFQFSRAFQGFVGKALTSRY